MSDKVSRLNYCQYLLVSQINYTLTNFADHSERLSHDGVNRYLRGERITPCLVWDKVRAQRLCCKNRCSEYNPSSCSLNISHRVLILKHNSSPFKWRHYEPEIILLCVRWYLRYQLSYRYLKKMMKERGLSVDHYGTCSRATCSYLWAGA